LITLTEIASRALSPGINDPGTAIQIIGSHEKLFFLWNQEIVKSQQEEVAFDSIEVPSIPMADFFEDAFRPIARDGAGNIEVMLRLQKAYSSLYTIDHPDLKAAAMSHSKAAFSRAKLAIEFKDDLKILKKKSLFDNKK